MKERPKDLADLQATAAVGQGVLVEAYDRALQPYGRHAAQVLLTADDLDDRTRYLNARNTIFALLDYGAVPIINENDTISTVELQTSFGDNDRLARASRSAAAGVAVGAAERRAGPVRPRPDRSAAKLISKVERVDEAILSLAVDKSSGLTKGGMGSKLNAARVLAAGGGCTVIAAGAKPNVLTRHPRRRECRHLVPGPWSRGQQP